MFLIDILWWNWKIHERKTDKLTNFKVGSKELLQIWSLDHVEIQGKKSEDRRGFIFLPLFCIKECKDVLARHKALFHIPNFQVVQREHILLFFFLERERGAGALIKDIEACQWQHITWAGQHLMTAFWYPHTLCWYQLPRNKSYLK